MANIANVDGATLDGTYATTRNNDIVELAATNDSGVRTPHVAVPGGVNLTGPLTAFGELKVESKTPQVQIKFPYGFVHPDIAAVLTNKTGSTHSVANGQCTLTCSSTAEAFSQLRTHEAIRYGPGQGAEFLGTAVFSTGVTNSYQLLGPGDHDEGFYFGYNGADFGVCRKSGGSLEVRSLEITAGASSTGNITITLDSTAVTVALLSTDTTIAKVTEKIVAASADFFNAGHGYEVHTDDNVSVEFISLRAEPGAGTFSFTDTGSTGVTASAFSTIVTGIVPTSTWVLQSAWNVDVMDGTGISGMTLDPTKGNVYGIEFQYLGYGAVSFYIEDMATGRPQLVHVIKYAGSNTTPTLVNPTLQLNALITTETGYSGGALTLSVGSMAGFIQGLEATKTVGIRRSISVSKTLDTTEQVLLILHNEIDFNGKINKISVYPDFTSFATESTKTTTLRLYRNPTRIVGGAALTDIETNISVMAYSSTGSTVIGGKRLLTFILTGSGGGARDLNDILSMYPGERLVLTGQISSGASAIVSAAYTWVERI